MFEILANLNSFVYDMGIPQSNFIEILKVGKGDVRTQLSSCQKHPANELIT